ncbi:sphingomyelin phosphodiesterase 4 [Lingula anatina]|uniref:Sphingomyelin phosphodiesterase 4 n=1 Tax=Lingula anatina TaxID=7574 RepID=A0A1S3IAF2_LINAN|nr:sphingomyelin phosphodiesterase 4 [Lingula anatina]|eukprot:XP_013394836.1 sphingomyelin phosphodiesterase 4 [Lingula anatina]
MATSSPAGAVGVLTPVSVRVQQALLKPVHQRCQEIQHILEETSTKDLHQIFPYLVENIFGFNNQPGWGVGTIAKSTQQLDYDMMRQFLSPGGPLIRVVYRLQADPMCRYDFPLSCLPFPTRQMFEDNSYHGASHIPRQPSARSLSAFEFYFFHYFYLCVNPQQRSFFNWSNASEALFTSLLEDYLNCFLPLKGKVVNPMPTAASPIRSPVAHKTHLHRQGSTSGYHSSGSPGLKPLVSLLKSPHSPHHQVQQRSIPYQVSTTDPLDQEMWRSETFVEILVEFWLNQNSLDSPEHHGGIRQAMIDGYQRVLSYSDPYYNHFYREVFLPNSDQVRVVRMFIKHLHFFANSASPDLVLASYQAQNLSPLDEFKRNVIPQMVQKKLYVFLRHGFNHWPLDSSFRLLLETWLSYVQPWRYVDPNAIMKEKESKVDNKWFQFIVDNLLFYTHLFQEFLHRSQRMDLSSAKNAYMLFRVTKVFGLPNLRNMLEEAEHQMYESHHRLSRRGPQMDMGSSYLSHSNSVNTAAILSLQFAELEGPAFLYKPLFEEGTKKQIEYLLQQILHAKSTSSSTHKSSDGGGSGGLLSWLGYGALVDYNATKFTQTGFPEEDQSKLVFHLEQAARNLCNLFQLSMESVETMATSVTPPNANSSANKFSTQSLPPDFIESPTGPVLTQLGKYQLMNGLRKFEISYQGNPDLQPIRSYECAPLVRILHQVSSFLNNKFSDKIQNYYTRDDMVGKMTFILFSPPSEQKGKKSSFVASPTRTKDWTTPRISLRFLANYQTLGYLMGGYLFFYMFFGMGPVGFSFILMLGLLLSVFFRALVLPASKFKQS